MSPVFAEPLWHAKQDEGGLVRAHTTKASSGMTT